MDRIKHINSVVAKVNSSTSTAKNVMKKLKEIGFVKEVKGKGKYTFISDFIYVKMKVAKLN